MKLDDVRKRAFAMPLTSPAFPPGPYHLVNREYLIIAYRTDRDALEAVIPEPLTFDEPSNMSSSACRIRPASGITRNPARSSR